MNRHTNGEMIILPLLIIFVAVVVLLQSCSTQKHVERSEQTKTVDSSTIAKKSVDTSKTTVVDIIHETIVYRDTTGKNITTERTISRVLHKNTYVYDTIHKTQVVNNEYKKQEKTDKETKPTIMQHVRVLVIFLAACVLATYLITRFT